jgi:excisionase family DNA binding protein
MVAVQELLRAREVASILRVHAKTSYQLAREGRLPVVRLGPRAVRFRREDVERLVAESLVGGRS